MKPKQDESVGEGSEQEKKVTDIRSSLTKIEQLEEDLKQTKKDLKQTKKELEGLSIAFLAAQNKLTRCKIVVASKLTRRQQKMWPKWIEGVDLSGELKTKETFAFPKIGLQAMDGGKYVRLTGTTQKEGLTKEEGVDICEYLNSFPENQHHLKNLDSEFRDEEQEAKLRAEMKK
jgi:hypothetical protein